jgi:hypothetical protein
MTPPPPRSATPSWGGSRWQKPFQAMAPRSLWGVAP